MPEIEIRQDPQVAKIGDRVTLIASVSENPTGYQYSWTRPDGPRFGGATLVVTLSNSTLVGKYLVTATPTSGGEALPPREYELNAEQAGPTSNGQGNTRDAVLVFDVTFAWVTGITILIVGVILVTPFGYVLLHAGLDDPDIDKTVLVTTLGLLTVGTLVMLSGIYGGLLEVRGRLRTKKDRRDMQEIVGKGVVEEVAKALPATIEAIGKLSGAALILVVACVPLVAAAWIANSAVSNDSEPTPTPSVSATASASPADTSGGGAGPVETNR